MYNDYEVGVWNRGPSTKEGGITIPGVLELTKTIYCDVQPYSAELLLRSYGYQTEVTKRFFIDDIEGIQIGTILSFNGTKHLVKKVIEWSYYEVMTLETTVT